MNLSSLIEYPNSIKLFCFLLILTLPYTTMPYNAVPDITMHDLTLQDPAVPYQFNRII